MKTNYPTIPFTTISFFLLLFLSSTRLSADDPDQLLELFLETGSFEFSDKIRQDFPASPHSQFCDAWEYLGANNEKARELANTLIQDHADFAPGHFVLGAMLTTGYKEYSEALIAFDRCIEISPAFLLAYQYRGIAKIGLGDFEGAKGDFDTVMKLKRGYAQGFILRGTAKHKLGDYEGMQADFEIGIQLDFRVLSSLPGDLTDDAISNAIEAAPENAFFYYARGYANFKEGNFRTANTDFKKCIELVPGNSEFYKYSGASKMELADYEGGQKDLNYALSVNPDDPETYYFLGVLMNDHMRQAAMAREYLNNAIGLDQNTALYYFERSKATFKMLDNQEALNDINKALELNHRNGDFYAHRANIKMKTGEPADDYCLDFKKAIEWGTNYSLKRVMKKSCKD